MANVEMTYGDVLVTTLFFIALVVCITLTTLLAFHCNLIRLNRTTMERQSLACYYYYYYSFDSTAPPWNVSRLLLLLLLFVTDKAAK